MSRLPIRNAVAYVVSDTGDPSIDSLERQGQPLHVVSIRRDPIAFLKTVRLLRARGIAQVHAGDARSMTMARTLAALSRAKFTAGPLAPQAPVAIPMLDLDWSTLAARSLGVRWMSKRLDNAVAEVAVYGDAAARDVIVKQSFAQERARHESRTLALLETVGAPRVLLYDDARATIVMERAPGISLDRIFATRDVAAILAGAERAGAWLAAMQEHTRSTADAQALLAHTVEGAIQDARVLGGDERARVTDRLRALERAVAAQPLAVAGHHGDYWPGNIFIDGARATVIDFEGFRDGLPLEDAAYFLIRTELLARRFRVRATGLGEAFFRGYGSTPDTDALALFTMTKGLRTLANNTGGNLPLPQRLWTRRVVRNAVLRCV